MDPDQPRARPILFSAPMVRALLREENAKTQTRRVVKPTPPAATVGLNHIDGTTWACIGNNGPNRKCPYGVPGDRLWVRETWGWSPFASMPPSPDYKQFLVYAADEPAVGYEFAARPSIHMFRWASRITLEITDVRVERLQDISEADAKAEGVDPAPGTYTADFALHGYVTAYAKLWDQINGAGAWDKNPWTWALTFRRVQP